MSRPALHHEGFPKEPLGFAFVGVLETDGFRGKRSKWQVRVHQGWHQALCRKSEAGREPLPGVGALPAELLASLGKLGVRKPA